MKIEQLKNNKIAILGFGKEGKSTLDFLNKIGVKDITILDKNDIEKNNKYKDLKYISGDKYLDNLGEYDLIFKTPGISPYQEKIIPYKDKLTSNAEVFFDEYEGKIIGITATKGKSTTSTLLYEILREAGYKVRLVGNIGNSIFDEVDLLKGEIYDYIIYELSSYMLETLKPKLFIGILGNIYPCHIDWHNDSMEVYAKAKTNILINSENIIINEKFTSYLDENFENKNIKTFGEDFLNSYYTFDETGYFIDKMLIKYHTKVILEGEHNKYNISSVIGAVDIINNSLEETDTEQSEKLFDALDTVLESFEGLPHRQEEVGEFQGIKFINDSISTTPESTIEAIKTFGEEIGTIMLGGADYGFTDESFENLKKYIIKYNIPNIILFVDTGSRVLGDFSKNMKVGDVEEFVEGDYKANVLMTDSMDEAIRFAYGYTDEGDICILSSASPSFSLWKSYVEKADEFIKYMVKYGE